MRQTAPRAGRQDLTRALIKRLGIPFIFFVNVNRFTLVGQMGSDNVNREASQRFPRSGPVPMRLFDPYAILGSDIMETGEIGNSSMKNLPEAKWRAFSRRSVLTFAGALGAAAPFGIFGMARALTASGVGSLPYIPGEPLICRTAANGEELQGATRADRDQMRQATRE